MALIRGPGGNPLRGPNGFPTTDERCCECDPKGDCCGCRSTPDIGLLTFGYHSGPPTNLDGVTIIVNSEEEAPSGCRDRWRNLQPEIINTCDFEVEVECTNDGTATLNFLGFPCYEPTDPNDSSIQGNIISCDPFTIEWFIECSAECSGTTGPTGIRVRFTPYIPPVPLNGSNLIRSPNGVTIPSPPMKTQRGYKTRHPRPWKPSVSNSLKRYAKLLGIQVGCNCNAKLLDQFSLEDWNLQKHIEFLQDRISKELIRKKIEPNEQLVKRVVQKLKRKAVKLLGK